MSKQYDLFRLFLYKRKSKQYFSNHVATTNLTLNKDFQLLQLNINELLYELIDQSNLFQRTINKRFLKGTLHERLQGDNIQINNKNRRVNLFQLLNNINGNTLATRRKHSRFPDLTREDVVQFRSMRLLSLNEMTLNATKTYTNSNVTFGVPLNGIARLRPCRHASLVL